MTEILFIRHAATDLAGTFCGHLDPPVNALGFTQIQRLIAGNSLTGFSAVYSSDLQRARTTAEAIVLHSGGSLQVDPAWRELSFGAWEGLTWTQIEGLDAAYARRWTDEFPNVPAPQGELYSAFCARILQALDLLWQQAMERVAVVTHAGVLRVVLQERCGVEASRAWALTKDYCCGFRLSADGTFEVLR